MKMISTARLRKAKVRSFNASRYQSEIYSLFCDVFKRAGDLSHPLLEKSSATANADVIVISSDKGLCGTFNENLFKFMRSPAEKNGVHFVLGRKGRDHLKRLNKNIAGEIINASEAEIEQYFEKLVNDIVKRFLGGESCGAFIFYNRLEGSTTVVPNVMQILPIPVDKIKKSYQPDYIYDPSAAKVLDSLVHEFISSTLNAAYANSVTAELTARMVAMENATKNADDLIKRLTLDLNRARQTAITTELMDIVGGAEALK
jgi:F-type H+-transporting ATPase subunit gamma